VGTAIGEAKINIGSYHVARKEREALAVIAVDQPPDARLLGMLEAVPEVLEVRLANLRE
jgi:D-3-phosphoglycerate dehydrogenase